MDISRTQRNLKLTIEYDGTGFSGWQRQPQARTVQGELEAALMRICGEAVELEGTGRTDAGVHALGQCATFLTHSTIPEANLQKALNDILAESRLKGGAIRIRAVEEMPADFHARFSAVGKTYVYRINNAAQMPVFLSNYRYNVKTSLNVEAMRSAAAAFVGRHDFACFWAMGSSPQKTTVRTIFGINVEARKIGSLEDGNQELESHELENRTAENPEMENRERVSQDSTVFPEQEIAISVTGDGFLYNMVRIIAGTLVDIGSGRIPAEAAASIIESKDRARAGHTAPPQGLYMAQVYYDMDDMLRGASAKWI